MRKEILLLSLFIMAFSMISFVSAGDVTLEISTYANHDVSINVINPSNEESVYSLTENSGTNGKAIFDFSTGVSRVDISVIVRKNGKIVVFEKFGNIVPSGQISFKVLEEDPEPEPEEVENVTENQTINEVNETEEVNISTTDITPNETSGTEEAESGIPPTSTTSTAKIIVYVLLGIFLTFIIVGLILFFIFRNKVVPSGKIKVKKYSEIKKEESEGNAPKTEDEKKLQEMEDKIKRLQNEVSEIRNRKTRIKEAEEKLKKDMEELQRLKRANE